MRKKETISPPLMGGSALLVIFAVLCMTIFALLGLSTVQADSRLSDKSSEAMVAYYQADYQAEEILAQLRKGTIPYGVESEGDLYRYACEISDTQELQVEVLIHGDEYRVLKWQTVSTTSWQIDEELPVWDGA